MQDLKASFRTLASKNLANFPQNQKLRADKKINFLLKNLIISLLRAESSAQSCALKTPKNILIYVPLKMEVNIFPLILFLKKQKNIKIFSPFILKNGKNANKIFKIVPFRLPLEANKFKIFEPKDSHFSREKIDIAIVPILGVDCKFGRVGFGKGMYDRFCAKNRPKKIIFVSRICNFSSTEISQRHDIKGDFIIASRGSFYDFNSSWIKRGDFSHPVILYRKKILHKIAESCHRAGKN